MIVLLNLALAATPMDLDWQAESISKSRPDCSSDYECTQAIEKQKSEVKREATSQARSFCKNAASTFGFSKGEYKSVYIKEMNPVISDYDITWYVSGKVKCVFYQS
jgi:hypothetical protein